ncbi:hypothetical protein P7C73_g6263, partial [Tremellales sp. Uapishka_1]
MFKNLPTFKSLPSAIGLPFLSTQEDAQLTFKAGTNGIKRLSGDEVIPLTDSGYWSQYYDLFNSAGDVYSLISVQDIRQALSSQPTNLANLIISLSHHLFTLLPSPVFPTAPGNSSNGPDSTKQALNCLRVLGRILVVVYETEAEARDAGQEQTFAHEVLWQRQRVERAVRRTSPVAYNGGKDEDGEEGENQFTIEDSDSEDGGEHGLDEGINAFKDAVGNPAVTKVDAAHETVLDPLSQPPAEGGPEVGTHDEEEREDCLPCLADRLFSCTIDLLFCAGFTVPDNVRGQDGLGDKINYVIWEKGVGSTVDIGSSVDLDRNKTEVLRFLLVLLSNTIYTSPHALLTTVNLPLQHLTHSLERRLVLSLLCSFLNTSLTTAKASAGIGSQLPYNHLVSKAAEERRSLVRTSFSVLLAALDYKSVEEAGREQMGDAKDENAFRYFVSKLHRKDDFQFVLGGILAIMEEQAAVTNGYLPGSKKPIPYILETFMLLWRMVDLNKRFRHYLLESGKSIDIVGHILICCLEFKDDPAHHGLLRLLSYLLQTLSIDQAFAEALNRPIRLAVPARWAVAGTAADFMIVSIYSIATTPGLNPLFPALTISITNIAPYLKNIGVQASTRLLQLFKAFSAPNFLLADDGHPRLVYYLLETFNSILYHQLNDNPNLVYAILRSHHDFQTLATFTLASGLRDIQRRKALRAAAEKPADDIRGIRRTNSELAMLAEKAALLGREAEDQDEPTSPAEQRRDPTESPALEASADPLTVQSPAERTISDRPAALSEKAKGKMKATESTSSLPGIAEVPDIPDEELARLAAAGIGPNGYIPTQEWVSSWQKGLPLDPVLVAISELLPKIQDSQPPRAGGPSSKVLNLLKGASLEDVLPPAQPIMPRRFQWSPASNVWMTSLLWGDIFVAGLAHGIWSNTTVKLFGVKQAPVKGRTAQVGRMLKMIGVV